MKILTIVFSNAFDGEINQPEFVLLDLSKLEVVEELRRWRMWAKTISATESFDTNTNRSKFHCIVVEDNHQVATFFNDSERDVVGQYLTDPDEEFLGRPFLGDTDVCTVEDDVVLPDETDEHDPLLGDDGCVSYRYIYERDLCVTPRGFFVEYKLKDTSVGLQSQLVPWKFIEEYEEALMVK